MSASENLEGIVSRFRKSISLEGLVNFIESRKFYKKHQEINPEDTVSDSKVKRFVCYSQLGYFLPGDKQHEYSKLAEIKETTLTKSSLIFMFTLQGVKYGLGGLGGYVPLAGLLAAGLQYWALVALGETIFRAGYCLISKKPVGGLLIEIPYKLVKHIRLSYLNQAGKSISD